MIAAVRLFGCKVEWKSQYRKCSHQCAIFMANGETNVLPLFGGLVKTVLLTHLLTGHAFAVQLSGHNSLTLYLALSMPLDLFRTHTNTRTMAIYIYI